MWSRCYRLLNVAVSLVLFTSVSGISLQDRQRELVQEFARAFTDRVELVSTNISGWECKCAFHGCGGNRRGNDTKGSCIDSRALDAESTCEAQGKTCTPVWIFEDRSLATTAAGHPPEKLGDPSISKALEAAEDLCMLQELEKEDVYQDALEWGQPDKKFSGWAYFGTPSGISMQWPGRAMHRSVSPEFGSFCEPFDPRLRPWYAPAMSPNKAVVFLVDRRDPPILTRTLETLLSTLSFTDRLEIIPYAFVFTAPGKHETTPSDFKLQRANIESKIEAKSRIQKGGVGLFKAFELAFDLLKGVAPHKADRLVLFLSNGRINPELSNKLLDYVDDLQSSMDKRANIFSYTFEGPASDDGFDRKLACRNDGLWTGVADSGKPDINHYYSFISLPAEYAEEEPTHIHFSEVYEDSEQLGDVITVSKAFYRNSACGKGHQKRRIQGVVGIDTQVVELSSISDYNNFLAQEEERGKTLSIANVPDISCLLQMQRAKTSTQCAGHLNVDSKIVQHNDRYFMIPASGPLAFHEAEKRCNNLKGVLATVDTEEIQPLLASIVPEDGAWIGYRVSGDSWSWAENNESAVTSLFWANKGHGSGQCAFLDSRGELQNVVKANCEDERSYICQIRASTGNLQASHLFEVENTAGVCAKKYADCSFPNTLGLNLRPEAFCNWKHFGGDTSISLKESMCCPPEDYTGACVVPPRKSEKIFEIVMPIAVGLVLFISAYLLWKVWNKPKLPSPPLVYDGDILRDSSVLGRGASGRVKKGVLDDRPVAIKVYNEDNGDGFYRERDIYQSIPYHNNILRLLAVQERSGDDVEGGVIPRSMCLILELMDMDLEQYMKTVCDRQSLTYGVLLKIFLQITAGIEHLHRNKVIHRDIKPQNILVHLEEDTCHVKLCDFNHGKEFKNGLGAASMVLGSRGYMSPEVMNLYYMQGVNGVRVGTGTDIYSLGVVMAECIVGDNAFGSEKPWDKADIPEGIKKLVSDCRRYEASSRPKATEVSSQLHKLLQNAWASHRVFPPSRLEALD